ncbi:MAG: beta-glucosidase [Candidatus Epulonipiscioides saccharophilum]|nr:MAG: beta-glucosidase [Epulopiscium sp. AS2M-Bin001]
MKIGVPLNGFAKFARKVAADGFTLLKNRTNFLPLIQGEKIAIFGRCQIDYYRSGTGSGGAVNTEYKTNFLTSLEERKFVEVDQAVKNSYLNWLELNPFDNGGGGWAAEPWCQAEMPLNEELVKTAALINEKAIIVIGRTAGEDKDNVAVAGSYLLTDAEINMINVVKAHFKKIGIIINVGNIIDTSWVDDKIDMLAYSWHGGQEGGNALVDVLIGQVTPSGKLPDSIALSISDYPQNHGGKKENIYEEDIYVGYRYLETFAPDRVLYPFGYGLSYTEFDISDISGHVVEDRIEFQAKVTNIGKKYSGREVIQIYLEAPQGLLGKASRSLVGFIKTPELEPKQSITVEIIVPFYNLASYDDSGITGYKSAYILESGEYKFYLGNSVKAPNLVVIDGSTFWIDTTKVIEQLQEALAPIQNFNRIKPLNGSISYEKAPTRTIDLAERVNNVSDAIEITGDKGLKLKDAKSIDEFIAQLSIEDLSIIVRGEGMSHPQVTPGTASAFGGVTEHLRSLGIPLMCTADGPSGIRMESGLKATQLPIGTLLASTWDPELIEFLYKMEGQELKSNYIDLLLGPGMNIHRSPLNGRNFEYFSEDPLLTGKMAAAMVRGIHKGGAEATLKHFACNSQEAYRHQVNSVVSERALREIYLKGFEIAVKEGHAKSVMTAYNSINGHWCASNYDLNSTILRDEWKFDGIVMTDWWASMNDTIEGGPASKKDTADMVRSQNDLYMVVGNFGAETNINQDNILEYLANGKLTISQLQRSAKNICNFAKTTAAINRDELIFGSAQVIEPDLSISQEGLDIIIDELQFDGKNYTFMFDGESGVHQLDAIFSCSAAGLFQLSCNIFLNDKIITTIQTGNTDNKSVKRKLAEVDLKPGVYTFNCEGESIGDKLIIEKLIFVK